MRKRGTQESRGVKRFPSPHPPDGLAEIPGDEAETCRQPTEHGGANWTEADPHDSRDDRKRGLGAGNQPARAGRVRRRLCHQGHREAHRDDETHNQVGLSDLRDKGNAWLAHVHSPTPTSRGELD